MARRTLYGTVIVTYRCNAHCNMCDCFRDPTRPEEEITLEDIKKLPEMAFRILQEENLLSVRIFRILSENYIKNQTESLFLRTDILQTGLLLYVRSFLRLESVSASKDCRKQMIKSEGYQTDLIVDIKH